MDQREKVFGDCKKMVEKSSRNLDVTCFQTSIWDEALYEAWSAIVYSLIPNISRIESNLKMFCELCNADEVVLFEKATFLVISHYAMQEHHDRHRFEKVSNIIKQFKLSCSKMQFAPGTLGGGGGVSELQVQNSKFSALVTEFTTNTFIMIVTSNSSVLSTAVRANVHAVKGKFEKFIAQSISATPSASNEAGLIADDSASTGVANVAVGSSESKAASTEGEDNTIVEK